MKKYILISALSVMAIGASAQDLQKEVTVNRTIEPTLRESYRLTGATPTLITPTVSKKKLNTAEYTSPGKINNEAGQLPPAPWRDSIPHTPYKGYASLGYFPLYNLGANAGYRFIDKPGMGAGAWMQYDGAAYKGDMPNYDKAPMGHHYITLGANGDYRIGAHNLWANMEYTHASLKTPYTAIESGYMVNDKYRQRAHEFDADFGWYSTQGNFLCNASFGFEHFAFGNNMPQMIAPIGFDPVKENIIDINLGIGMNDGYTTNPWIGVNLDWAVLKSNELPSKPMHELAFFPSVFRSAIPEVEIGFSKGTISLGHLKPYLVFGNEETVNGRFGLNISMATGNSHGHLRIAPDMEIAWKPITLVQLYAKAKGGEELNRMSTVFDINPYVFPYIDNERTNHALNLEGGVEVGPHMGFSLKLFAGYAHTRSRLVPMIMADGYTRYSTFKSCNTNSWHAGANASYTYRSLFKVEADIEAGGSPTDYTSWVEWNDGAHLVARLAATAKPIEPLDVTVSYELRNKRKCLINDPTYMSDVWNLGNVGSLNIGGSYAVTPQLSGFIFVENLLNKRYALISGLPAQGIKGLCGVAYKF